VNRNTFDALTRRASLMALGAAGISAMGQTDRMSAKKKRKKGDVNKLCKRQVSQCLDFYLPQCEDGACLARFNRCCPQFGTCNFFGFYDCIRDAMSMEVSQRPSHPVRN
jgi:hypothetical protein